MFDLDHMTITMSIGDTGAVYVRGVGYDFSENDRAVFTVRTPNGGLMIEREYQMDENGGFILCFHNADTEGYPAGTYSWDVRYVINPYRDETGAIVDGDQVITPYPPQSLILQRTVGTI